MLHAKKIAIIRLSSIGDVLHCTPVARMIKEKVPSCHITWIVGQVSFPMVEFNPFVDEVYVWSREEWEILMRQGKLIEAWQMLKRFKQEMSGRGFDVALDIHGLFLSGLITRLTGAPRRIGLGGTKEGNGLFMTEQARTLPQDVHVIQRYLSILRPLGLPTDSYSMTLCLPTEAREFAARFLAQSGVVEGEKIILINPATTWPAKNWPAEYFAEVANSLASCGKIIICGGPGDVPIASEVEAKAHVPAINAAGKTGLLEMAALIEKASLLIVGDTGPLHMAVALGVPTVSIFGATDPAKFGPLSRGHAVLRGTASCMPCHKMNCPSNNMACMYSIRPEKVINSARRLLANRDNGEVIRHGISIRQR